VGLRLTAAERAGRVEAIEHTIPVEKEQPILRPPPRRKEQQLGAEERASVREREQDHRQSDPRLSV
jgi:hypothetical protein